MASSAAAAPKLAASNGFTPNNSAARLRTSAAAPITPAAIPARTIFTPRVSTRETTSTICAPSAIRMPNSRLRWLTPKANTAKMPTAESSNASAAKPPSSRARNLGRAMDSATISSMVRTRVTASCLSSRATTPFTAAVKASGSPSARTAMEAPNHAFCASGT